LSGTVSDAHLARVYGIHVTSVRLIRIGKNWAWL
jgi:hypothetical protein